MIYYFWATLLWLAGSVSMGVFVANQLNLSGSQYFTLTLALFMLGLSLIVMLYSIQMNSKKKE